MDYCSHLRSWRSVLFTDESQVFTVQGQSLCRRVGEQFADANIVDNKAHGDCEVLGCVMDNKHW